MCALDLGLKTSAKLITYILPIFLLLIVGSNKPALYITKSNYKLLFLIRYSVSLDGDYEENKSKLSKILVDIC